MHLILLRHGQSEWNKKNLFTGLQNPPLSPEGRKEAQRAALALEKENFRPTFIFSSILQRAIQTAEIVGQHFGYAPEEIQKTPALNERDYGDLTGKNKDDIKKEFGAEQLHRWRRSFTEKPGIKILGESLEDTAGRVIHYYETHVKPTLQQGYTTLIVAHGNSLRALIMHLEHITSAHIMDVTLDTGEPIVYNLDHLNKVASKKIIYKNSSGSKKEGV